MRGGSGRYPASRIAQTSSDNWGCASASSERWWLQRKPATAKQPSQPTPSNGSISFHSIEHQWQWHSCDPLVGGLRKRASLNTSKRGVKGANREIGVPRKGKDAGRMPALQELRGSRSVGGARPGKPGRRTAGASSRTPHGGRRPSTGGTCCIPRQACAPGTACYHLSYAKAPLGTIGQGAALAGHSKWNA